MMGTHEQIVISALNPVQSVGHDCKCCANRPDLLHVARRAEHVKTGMLNEQIECTEQQIVCMHETRNQSCCRKSPGHT